MPRRSDRFFCTPHAGHLSHQGDHQDVDPQISCYYKSSQIKQYFKEHHALRTETVVCDTRDFGRVLAPGVAALDTQLPKDLVERSELARAWRQLDRRLDRFAENGVASA